MGFDLASAKPVAASGGFDLATARPVGGPASDQIPATERRYPTTQADQQRAQELAAPDRTWRDDNLLGKAFGLVEAPLTIASHMAVTPLAALAKAYNIVTNPNGQSGTALDQSSDGAAEAVSNALAYQPRTGTGAQLSQLAGAALAPLGTLSTSELAALGHAGAGGVRGVRGLANASADAMAAQDAAQAANPGKLRDLVRKPQDAAMPGVGAASTGDAALRVATADQLPVPMGRLMTKGMRTRAKPDLAFEAIAAKDPELGAGLRNRTVEVNQAALDNFDAFAEATRSEKAGLKPVGKVVDDYLIKRVEEARQEVRKNYNDAAESVEGKVPADTAPLRAYLDQYAAEAAGPQGVPALKLARSLLDEFDPAGTGKIPLKEYNQIRERVGKISPEGSISSAYRKPIQVLVDDAVEANGGPLYRTARRSHENFKNEFKNAGAIDRLLRTKPGTNDRATALEDVVTKSTLDAPSADDVRHVKTTLTRKQDPEGLQAWKEVQGETARQIKERVLTTSKNEGGQFEVSPAALTKIVRELDADGRLEVIFSKQGAQKWRDLADTVADVKTVPAGTVSSAGTAEVLAGLLDTAVSGFTGLPLPVASALNYGAKRLRRSIKTKKINAALNPDAP